MGGTPAQELDRYRQGIEDFTERLLRRYLNSLDGPNNTRAPKEFNDPVWGTIVLDAHEVVVMDSPLLQRLRRIRQLGVVHYVYPGANHSRFEHSLGVCHQVGQLAASLEAHGGEFALTQEWVSTLRLAGLCHDVGHGLMSHVVENALADDETSDDLLLSFQRQTKRATLPQLSEMAAYYMMRSPAVVELLQAAHTVSNRAFDTKLPDRIAKMIIGQKVDDRFPLVHELISGPFDADKLDYMPRDAKMCGVPVVTDVVRLIQKVRSVPLSFSKLPPELTNVNELQEGHIITGVARSGASALDEVSLSRSLMFDKIYRHHKVRAVEAMVSAVLDNVTPLLVDWTPLLPLQFADDEFVALDRSDLDLRNSARDTPLPHETLASAAEILQRLRDRNLFVRAFAFAQKMPFDAYSTDPAAREANEGFIRELSDQPDKREEFLTLLVTNVERIAGHLGRAEQLTALPGNLRDYIRVDPPTSSGRGSESDQSRAFLIEDQRVFKVEKVRAENRGWADAYVNTKDVGFVFSPREIMDMVHIAAEVSARTMYEVRIPEEMRSYAKVGGKTMETLRRDLESAGFYDSLPGDLRPQPEYLGQSAARTQVEAVLTNLHGYMGPDNGTATSILNAQRIKDWVLQFPSAIGPVALTAAAGVKMLSRSDANEALRTFASEHPEFGEAHIVPLGEPKDGSSIHTYHLGDSAKDLGYTLSTIEAALGADKPVIFVDDIIGRGSSAISIFEAWLGAESTESLDEDRSPALGTKLQGFMRESRIAVVATAGFTDGQARLTERLQSLGINATVYAMIDASSLPTIEGVLTDARVPQHEQEAFVEECRRIGQQLLDDGEERHDGGWREQRALGYGNFGLLVVSSYNTPTVCLTAMWSEGSVDHNAWRPLLPRRKKF
ncbi:HD domain-containing protein [Microbacterium sp. CJ88]|uniref:HD domain-containing protein n=1 Tax=Microbacterium sp. CJ88 TaxID=3445672 RepID=UPI003F65943F